MKKVIVNTKYTTSHLRPVCGVRVATFDDGTTMMFHDLKDRQKQYGLCRAGCVVEFTPGTKCEFRDIVSMTDVLRDDVRVAI